MTWQADAAAVVGRLPGVKGVHCGEDYIRLETTYPAPLSVVEVRLSEEYRTSYPCGAVSFFAGDILTEIPASERLTVLQLCHRVLHSCEAQDSKRPDSGCGMNSPKSSSWGQLASVELATPPTACGAGFAASVNELLQRDLEQSEGLEFVDHPALNRCTVTLRISLKALSDVCAESWEVLPSEPLIVILSFDRRAYLAAPVKVEVGQQRNFESRTFLGMPGMLANIVQKFCDAHLEANVSHLELVQEGWLLEDVVLAKRKAKCAAEVRSILAQLQDAPSVSLRAHPSLASCKGFFNRLTKYVYSRLPTLSSFCGICDHAHDTASLLRLSFCNREVCLFRFEELDVGKSFGFSAALHTGVVDLLVNFARVAALSHRSKLIFTPFPRITEGGKTVISPEDQESCSALVQEIFRAMPPTYKFLKAGSIKQQLAGVHRLAPAMFQWIVSSNTSQLIKLDPRQSLEFMETPYQYLLAMSSDARVEQFNQLKAKHGSVWAFHGSSGENWHSILRNGLKNASGTKLQVNGAAYGQGVYLSPHSSVSFGYSPPSVPAGSAPAATYASSYYYNYSAAVAPSQTKPEQSEFIDHEGMFAICIAEVIDRNIRKASNIWVQPDEECVLARFFFVYQRGMNGGRTVDLEKPELKRILWERCTTLTKK